jgi:hypothetical protein
MVRGGLLFKTGRTPPVGDVNRQDSDIAPLAALNRAIRAVRIDSWCDPELFDVESDEADAWLHRFDR